MARRTDFVLLGLTLLLLTIGLAMLYSTSAVLAQMRYQDSLYFLKRQLVWAGLGLLGLWVMRSMPYSIQRRLAVPALLVTLVTLILVLLPIFGKEVGGARRWLTIGPLSIQPSEFAKYTLLYLANSEGCMDSGPIVSQRRAPPTSLPKMGRSTRMRVTSVTRSAGTARRRWML